LSHPLAGKEHAAPCLRRARQLPDAIRGRPTTRSRSFRPVSRRGPHARAGMS